MIGIIALLQVAGSGAAAPPSPAPVPVAEAPASRLSLICRGTGDKTVSHMSVGGLFGRHGSAVAIGSGGTTQDQYDDEVAVEIDGAASRIRLPRRMHTWASKDHDGWLSLKDVVVTEDAINGLIIATWALHPRLVIDRRSGSISFNSMVTGAFAGSCARFDPAADKRAF